jgi:hydrogenase-4 membrane subunit HyfE
MMAADGGVVLALSLALLCPRQLGIALALASAQAAAVSLAALGRGMWMEALTILLLNAIGLPLMLRRSPMPRPSDPIMSIGAILLAGMVLTLLAIAVDGGGVPLAVVLFGVLVAATHRHKAMQVLGLLAMQNGIALAGLDTAGATRFGAILPIVPALAWLSLWARRRA